ncbi:ribosome silencing factor [Oxalobacteraceae bacterium CAVE-383]|nr:ribosome silencing factor [Oxalobacteraceae bacterium CAVE-383]
MDIKKLQAVVIDALENVKAQDIKVYDTSHLTSLFDRIAIASGTSNRQTKALAASVRDKVKEMGGNILSMEGEDTGEWVLVDLGDMIVHIMQPTIRAYYRLEEIWGEREVKFGAAVRTSKRTASEDEAPKKSRHLAASQATEEPKPKKAASTRKPAAATAGTARKPAAAKPAGKAKAKAPSKPVGKTVKVASTKTAVASKGAAVKKAAAKGATRAPAKRAPRAPAKPKAEE